MMNVPSAGNMAHAYIIEGDHLSGKKSFALGFARAVLCPEKPGEGCGVCPACRRVSAGSHEDLHIVRMDERSVKTEAIEDLQEELKTKPQGTAGRHVVIIEDADSMTARAQNRLLKTLEEPQPGTVIMLLSENRENLLPTIRSRCQVLRPFGEKTDPEEAERDRQFSLFARKLIETALRCDCFNDVKVRLEGAEGIDIKDRKDALAVVDAIERELRDCFVKEEPGLLTAERAMRCVGFAEEARQDIVMNVNHNYAIRNLLLKIGG